MAVEGSGSFGHIVEITGGVGLGQILCGWDDAPAQGQGGDDCFDRTAGSDQMSGHGFDGMNGDGVGVFAQALFDGGRLNSIVFQGACAVGVDPVDL